MAYGVLVILVPPNASWPEGWHQGTRRNAEVINGWRDRLTAWEQGIKGDADRLGGRSVLSFTPMHQAAVAQTNVWIDNVGEDLGVAMKEACRFATELRSRGHEIRSIQVLDWEYNPYG